MQTSPLNGTTLNMTYFLKLESKITFYLNFLQFQYKEKRKKALCIVWGPCQLVLCNSPLGYYNSL